MGIARMLYHQPRFAVLDECTSAVSVDAEEELYRAAMSSGTTCLTVSQRMTLPKFHKNEVRAPHTLPPSRCSRHHSERGAAAQLKVGVNRACGWSLEKIKEGQENQLLSGGKDDAMHATADLH